MDDNMGNNFTNNTEGEEAFVNPWDQREEVGFFPALGETIKLLFTRPTDFFKGLGPVETIKSPFLFYLAIALPLLLVTFGLTMAIGKAPNLGMGEFEVAMPVFMLLGLVFTVIGIFIQAGLMHLGVLMCGGKGGFVGTFTVLAYAYVTSIFGLIPFVGGLVGGIWGVILTIIGYKYVHKFTTGKAVLAYFLISGVLVIIAIVAMVAAVAIPNLMRARLSSNEALAQSTLMALSTASESYATANNGKYPEDIYDLTLAEPPYLNEEYCDMTKSGYYYSCDFSEDGYLITSEPEAVGETGEEAYSISTGGVLESSKESQEQEVEGVNDFSI